MAKKPGLKVWPVVGGLAFAIGILVAILAGFTLAASQEIVLTLGGLGIIVGLINVTKEEVQMFLISAIALVASANSLSSMLANIPLEGAALAASLSNVIAFVAPAAVVVALKAVYDITRSA